MRRGQNLIVASLFLVLAISFFSFSYLASAAVRPYMIGASAIPFALMIVALIKG